jgi:hypothetical protein
MAGLRWQKPPKWLLGVDRPPQGLNPLFFFKKKKIYSFLSLGVADPPPKGQGVASPTPKRRSGVAKVLY